MHLLVLSAFRQTNTQTTQHDSVRLNAPFGAQCFPTTRNPATPRSVLRVSMHLLVLSAFRPLYSSTKWQGFPVVSMHLLVLSAFRPKSGFDDTSTLTGLNAPFGAQCFPTCRDVYRTSLIKVSMHLLVLSAFRLVADPTNPTLVGSLNAPFGAQCFPTDGDVVKLALGPVSMHLLVLSAFRLNPIQGRYPLEFLDCLNAPFGAQCFPTGSVSGVLSYE